MLGGTFMSNITEAINFIIEEVRNAVPETSEKNVEKIEIMLRKATPDEVYRVADMFYRFDAKTIFEIIGEKHGNMGYVTN